MVIGVNLSQTINELLTRRYSEEVSDSIQRLSSGLKINDAADDVGGLVSSNRLQSSTSALRQGIENGNNGLALVQITNKALDNQTDILNVIKSKLNLSKIDVTSAAGREAIRVDIVALLSKLDDIASDTNFNSAFTLQKSDTNTDFSTSLSLVFDTNTNQVSTESIKSNSEGLGLDTLKNLASGALTNTVSIAQLSLVEDAISTVKGYSDSFNLTQNEIEIAVLHLTGSQKITNNAKNDILKADLDQENSILDKYKLLEESSKFAFVQANVTQSIVLKLLSTSLNINDAFTQTTQQVVKPKEDDPFIIDKKANEPFKTSFDSFTPNFNNASLPSFSSNNVET